MVTTHASAELRTDFVWGGVVHASVVRLAVLAIWLVIVAATPYHVLAAFASTPSSSFGLGHVLFLVEGARLRLLSENTLVLLKAGALLGILWAMVSTRGSRIVVPLIFVVVVLLDTAVKSVGGFANHAQVVPLLALGALAVYSGRRYISVVALVRGSRSQNRLEEGRVRAGEDVSGVVATVAVIVVLPYTYIGLQRLLVGGATLFSGDALMQYLSAATRSFETYPPWFSLVLSKPLLNLGFFLTTLLEASSPALLWSRKFRAFWLAGIASFQMTTLVLMNILFWENLVLALAVFWWGWNSAPERGPSAYWVRNADNGSMRVARLAGSHVAMSATETSTTAVAKKVTGSSRPTP
jgi:hypothetical protein